jgi:predicted ribosome quality control (RQC) complex YloA/Tae2 family protein
MKYLKKYGLFESKKPNYQTLQLGDFKVYRGRDAEANEYVTFQLADENDLWFHAKGVPGSHLVIKVGDKSVTPEIIQQAAQLVAKNSKSKSKEIVVVYCKKKFVTKESGAPLGKVLVDYKNAEEITVYLD